MQIYLQILMDKIMHSPTSLSFMGCFFLVLFFLSNFPLLSNPNHHYPPCIKLPPLSLWVSLLSFFPLFHAHFGDFFFRFEKGLNLRRRQKFFVDWKKEKEKKKKKNPNSAKERSPTFIWTRSLPGQEKQLKRTKKKIGQAFFSPSQKWKWELKTLPLKIVSILSFIYKYISFFVCVYKKTYHQILFSGLPKTISFFFPS